MKKKAKQDDTIRFDWGAVLIAHTEEDAVVHSQVFYDMQDILDVLEDFGYEVINEVLMNSNRDINLDEITFQVCETTSKNTVAQYEFEKKTAYKIKRV